MRNPGKVFSDDGRRRRVLPASETISPRDSYLSLSTFLGRSLLTFWW